MISQLTGLLVHRSLPFLVLDVNGVGYEVEATTETFSFLPALGEQATVYTHFVVREDAQLLFGFSSVEERDFFRTLIKINGVGPKLALAILSSLSPSLLVAIVDQADVAGLQKVPGVGKKTAERLIIELKDKFKGLSVGEAGHQGVSRETSESSYDMAVRESVSGLQALGYKPAEAEKMVKTATAEMPDVDSSSSEVSSEAIIRFALKRFMR